jgi:hypothetical protein
VPGRPFPPYAFVPGRSPHPTSDPAGHSFGARPAPPARLEPGTWTASEPYLYGLDLFNAGYYWEAHEAWEGLWHACGRKGTTADFLKGLIRLAAAGVKHLAGKPQGVRSHALRAAEVWRQVVRAAAAEEKPFLGFKLPALIALAEATGRDGWPGERPFLLPTVPQN